MLSTHKVANFNPNVRIYPELLSNIDTMVKIKFSAYSASQGAKEKGT